MLIAVAKSIGLSYQRLLMVLVQSFFCVCAHTQKTIIDNQPPECISRPLDNTSKLPIDSNTYEQWPTIRNVVISNDGRFVAYQHGPVKGQEILTIKSIEGKLDRIVPEGNSAVFTEDCRRVLYKLPNDSLIIFNLLQKKSISIANVLDFRVPKTGNGRWFSYLTKNKSLTIIDFYSKLKRTYENVDFYYTNSSGTRYLIQCGDKLLYTSPSKDSAKVILKGHRINSVVFDRLDNQVAFTTTTGKNSYLWYYRADMENASLQISEQSYGVLPGAKISAAGMRFSKDGKKIFFGLLNSPDIQNKVDNRLSKVDVWTYKDLHLQTRQLKDKTTSKSFLAVTLINSKIAIQLDSVNSTVLSSDWHLGNDYVIRFTNYLEDDRFWNKNLRRSLFLVSIKDGTAKLVGDGNLADITYASLSPKERFVIWFDNKRNIYYSYEIRNGITRTLLNDKTSALVKNEQDLMEASFGIAGWTPDDQAFITYGKFDILLVDPMADKPTINITNGYGSRTNTVFRVLENNWSKPKIFRKEEGIFLNAFNTVSKENGFYKLKFNDRVDPNLCSMGPYFYCMNSMFLSWSVERNKSPIKAKQKDVYVVYRESAYQSPNLYITRDFKIFQQISSIEPEGNYNWLTSELIKYPLRNGGFGEAILFKPKDFNPKKKYPVLFTYYDDNSSKELNMFKQPKWSTDGVINIPTYVSNEYIVCKPNLYYESGKTAEGIVNSVESAAKYLSSMPWVNSKKMGVQGFSYGGFATNCVITQSNMFVAACEGAGSSNIISAYGGIKFGNPAHNYFEYAQGNMGGNLWDKKKTYIDNSPVFNLEKVITPLLILHNSGDANVGFNQAIELFTGLRRLEKKVWLLQYDNGGHGLDETDGKDFSIRMQQFFDYYLKDMLPPIWMTKGIPAQHKQVYSGLDLDSSGIQP